MQRHSRTLFRSRQSLILPLLLGILVCGSELPAPSPARAQPDAWADPAEKKLYWQDLYRTLRTEAARLRRDIQIEETAYAAANRRNYRRGTARHVHRLRAAELQHELDKVERELAGFDEKARTSGALPGWLYEVEDEPIVISDYVPPSDDNDDNVADTDEDATAGRNPLYHEAPAEQLPE